MFDPLMVQMTTSALCQPVSCPDVALQAAIRPESSLCTDPDKPSEQGHCQ